MDLTTTTMSQKRKKPGRKVGEPTKENQNVRVSIQIKTWQLKALLNHGRHYEGGKAATIVKRVLIERFKDMAPEKEHSLNPLGAATASQFQIGMGLSVVKSGGSKTESAKIKRKIVL